MKKIAITMVCLTLALVSGCQREDKNDPLKIAGKIFIFNYRIAEATYVLTLARNGPLPDDSYVEARFDNPAGGAPLTKREKIFPFWDKITVESPPVHCIVKNKPYAVNIRIVDGKDKLIQTIDTTMTSTLDQTILPGKPLVVGPIYTPNPNVFRADGTTDFSPETGCPAKT
ncbi:hypothetical protein NAC44_06970 [Allorhizobium sp. BGMRC 0089]|uniref:hypothetical protein n=1 Tax=Allorhizobium sonneratiae TaxID=2934936 RepID=UPI002033DA00|nr:hypothetical protein [Allorhizobium sonneratiae]MCM2292072.1 hypothetical protein [Allorhizobium sonneratiae]